MLAVGVTALITVPSVVAIGLNMLTWNREAKEYVAVWLSAFIFVTILLSFAKAVKKDVEKYQGIDHSSESNRKEVNRGGEVND